MSTRIPRPPGARLASLKNPVRSQFSKPQITKPQSAANAKGKGAPKLKCACELPEDQNIQEENGSRVCLGCGTVFSEVNIVSEVTFGETSSGAATVEGGFVGENQSHVNTMGAGARIVGGGMGSKEQSEWAGRDEIRKLAGALNISQTIEDQAFSIWKLAMNHQFIQGRRTRTVAAVCLYAACRKVKGNTVLLIDLAEKIQVNVFKLGDVYKDLAKALWLGDATSFGINLLEVEPLIMKFARKLEFGSETNKVANDATQIIKRMKRDWMVEGRQPAGLCGACIILAARMNNFRRTVREVVYVVKVADTTIAQRIEEFKRTQSSTLTVQQFRDIGLKLKTNTVPPSIYKRLEREEKQKHQREESQPAEGETNGDYDTNPSAAKRIRTDAERPASTPDGDASAAEETSNQTETPSSTAPPQEPRRDADGFVIPDRPNPQIDPSLIAATSLAQGELEADDIEAIGLGQEPPKKKRKAPKAPPPVITEADLLIEEELEDEMETLLKDREVMASVADAEIQASLLRAEALAIEMRGQSKVSESEDIGEDEFADDPEIQNCLLTDEESAIKARIWVKHNEDWLRKRQAKILAEALDSAKGKTRKRQTRKRKHSRMGDGSVLEGGDPVTNAADAVKRMMEKRSRGFSKRLNYANINKIFNPEDRASVPASPSAASAGAQQSREQSLAPSEASEIIIEEDDAGQPPASPAPAVSMKPAPPRRLASIKDRVAGLTPPASQASSSQASQPPSRLASIRDAAARALATPPASQASQTPVPVSAPASKPIEIEDDREEEDDEEEEIEEEEDNGAGYGGGGDDWRNSLMEGAEDEYYEEYD